jgi:heme a synthase
LDLRSVRRKQSNRSIKGIEINDSVDFNRVSLFVADDEAMPNINTDQAAQSSLLQYSRARVQLLFLESFSLIKTTMASSSTALLQKGFPAVTNAAHNMYAPAGKWILGTAASVVGMIHVGGVTRLTQSGLSMTDWSPLGSLPPMTEEAWQKEFDRYKTFPEWQQRKSMTLSEFQYIYGWEYGHRMLGRTVGLIFVLPWAYFSLRGRIPAGYQKRMVGLLAMGGTQGLVGWWMVKSGLGDDRRGDKQEIRVRPVRLATHLSMAVATYGALLWTGMDILGLPHKQTMIDQASKLGKEALKQAARLRTGSLHLTALTGVTIVSGALVAGNDAGRAYNTFPKMDGEWIPSEISALNPWYKNLYENTATVQFNHRVLGISTAAGALGLVALGLSPARSAIITPQARFGLYAVGGAALGQVTLGITTLLQCVPISLAAAHQVGSVVVFSSGLYLAHSLRYARPALARIATGQTASHAAKTFTPKTATPTAPTAV